MLMIKPNPGWLPPRHLLSSSQRERPASGDFPDGRDNEVGGEYHPRLPSLILREKQAEGDAGMSNGHLL
jgi:hypothetical protein